MVGEKKREKEYIDITMTRSQVEKEINSIKQRIQNNIEIELNHINQLKTTDKIKYTQ